jgi:hypothetical protein
MKAADLNILGGLFGDFQQGVNFGRSIQDGNQARRLREQDNARQEKQLRIQMAQAQVAAEKAQKDAANYDENFRREGVKLGYQGQELGLRERGQIHTENVWAQKPGRDREAANLAGISNLAKSFDTPEAIVQALGLPPEALNDPETLAKVTELAKLDRGTRLNQKVVESRLTTRAAEGERTVAQEQRRLTEHSLGKDDAKEFSAIDKNIDKALQFDNFMDKEKLVKMSESQLMLQKSRLQNMDPASMSYKILGSAINAREAKLNVIKGSAQQPPAQQYQQPIGPAAAQQPIDQSQIPTWSPARKQAIMNANTAEEMKQAMLVP